MNLYNFISEEMLPLQPETIGGKSKTYNLTSTITLKSVDSDKKRKEAGFRENRKDYG